MKKKTLLIITIPIIITASAIIAVLSSVVDKEANAQTEINVYYSVGQNTTDHKTGTPTMTISSGVATFSAAQIATNMGVGDKITYNISSIAYISSKQSTTVWNVITATGAIPADVTDATVGSIAHAYDSLSAAIAGAVDASHLNTTDLVAGNYILNIPCYYDTGPDQTAVTINGYTTGVNNYIKIYTPNNTSTEVNQSQRHSGVWDTGKYRLEPISGDGIELWNQYVRIDGLQISSKEHGIYLTDPNLNPGTANGFMFSNNIIKYVGTGSHSGIYDYTCGTWGMKIWNNIVYNFPNIGIGGWNNGAAYFYNNTVINCGYGIRANEAAIVSKNNISYNNTDNYSGTFDASSTNNLSGNGQNDAPGTNPRNLAVGETITFVDEANNDFHLASNDAGARNYGADLSSDTYLPITTDIDGQTRPTGSNAVDIGADEWLPTVQFSASSLSGSESLTSVNIEVFLSAASFPDASVSYSVTGGTATGGDVDYTLASGTATITSGNTTTNIPITIINDDIDETDETIQITLSNPTNAILGSNTIHTYTIQDNDTVGITITESGGSTSITEGGQTDTYTAVLTSEPTSDVNITITPDDQSTTNPTSLTFTSANWSTPQTVAITAVDDSSQEGSHASTITHTSSSSDSNYNNISIVSVIASITDNDGGGPWPQDENLYFGGRQNLPSSFLSFLAEQRRAKREFFNLIWERELRPLYLVQKAAALRQQNPLLILRRILEYPR